MGMNPIIDHNAAAQLANQASPSEAYTPITVAQLADQLGHAGTDAIRKRWPKLFGEVKFSSQHLLTQPQYEAIVLGAVTHTGRVAIAESGRAKGQSYAKVPHAPVPPPRSASEQPVRSAPRSVASSAQSWYIRHSAVISVSALSAAVLLLVSASVVSVGEVIRESSPVGWFAYVVGLVICSAPLIMLTAGARLTPALAYGTMAVTLLIEVCCNAVAISRHTSERFVGEVYHATAMGDIALSWALGIGLPTLALLFEISLLNIVKQK